MSLSVVQFELSNCRQIRSIFRSVRPWKALCHFVVLPHVGPYYMFPMWCGDYDSRKSFLLQDGDDPPKERKLYRQGSLASQFSEADHDGIILKPVEDGDTGSGMRTPLHSISSSGGIRTRTPSGKSVRSRKASRAEYHHDLKVELESVSHDYVIKLYNCR